MVIFEGLPEVKKACFCLKLRDGSIVVAVFAAIDGLKALIIEEETADCYFTPPDHCEIILLYTILKYLDDIYAVILIGVSVAFLFSMCVKSLQHKVTTIFMYVLGIHIVLTVLTNVIITSASGIGTGCNMTTLYISICISMAVIMTFFYIYFLIIVKSYRSMVG